MRNLRPRNLTEYFRILWRRKILITLTTGVVLVSSLLVVSRYPDIYESSALVVTADQNGDETRQASASQIAYTTQRLLSRSHLEPLVHRYTLYQAEPTTDAQVEYLRKSIKFETRPLYNYPGSPEAILISYRHPDPLVARQVMTDLVSLFSRANESVWKQAADEVNAVRSKIDELENRLRQRGLQHAPVRALSDPGTLRAQRLAAAMSVEALSDKQYALERQIAEQQRQIAEQQQVVAAAPPATLAGPNSAAGPLLVRKAELEAQLDSYATQYTPKHPDVIQARNQLAKINQQLDKLNQAGGPEGAVAGSSEGRELRALQRDLARLQIDLEVTKRELDRKRRSAVTTPGLDSLREVAMTANLTPNEARTEADHDYLQNRYTSLLDRQDRLQRTLASTTNQGQPVFQIIDPPNFPLSAVAPNRKKLKLLALGFALLLGLVAGAAVEVPRLFVIHDDRDVEFYLDAPVIALIPETVTPAERSHRRRLLFLRRVVIAALVVAAIPVLVKILNYLDIF